MDITSLSNFSIEDDRSKSSSSSSSSGCSLNINYYDEEFYCYLFIMCPLALVGILLNLVSLKVFSDKSFNTVTFKYLRLITLTDCFICCIIIPYCITSYTQPFSRHDLFGRQIYLAYIYIPGANFAITLSMLLNLLVTLERLISVGWPTRKYKLFKPSRYYLSCVLVIAISLVLNLMNFFVYKIGQCEPSSYSDSSASFVDPDRQPEKLTNLLPRSFVMEKWWMMYGYVKEVLTRVLPILVLILLNIMLIYIVRSSRERMKESRGGGTGVSKHLIQQQQKGESPGRTQSGILCCFIGKKTNEDGSAEGELADSSGQGMTSRRSTVPNTNLILQSKKNRQENQLTIMTIVVAVLYIVTSIPMVFAYPGLVFTDMESKAYKMYAVLVNILELIQCSFRFVIYFCFTTQFRQVLYKMFGRDQLNASSTEVRRERAVSAATVGINQAAATAATASSKNPL